MLLLQQMLDKCRDRGLIRTRSDIRTDATHAVASVHNMNRSELVGETLRAALNVLTTVDPVWSAVNVDSQWYLKYAKRFDSNRAPRTKEAVIAGPVCLMPAGTEFTGQTHRARSGLHLFPPKGGLEHFRRRDLALP
jgi:hypothetical protein